jgi:hypothetical protein
VCRVRSALAEPNSNFRVPIKSKITLGFVNSPASPFNDYVPASRRPSRLRAARLLISGGNRNPIRRHRQERLCY